MDAYKEGSTRSGCQYAKAVGAYLTPVACPASFEITPLLRAALDAELDALPDIPYDSAEWDSTSISCTSTDTASIPSPLPPPAVAGTSLACAGVDEGDPVLKTPALWLGVVMV
ncbi:hypothetical protein NMY22_g10664 [Coprinellus aureogranulatus]|nr:hypothetical protein NMY22_g10664 [Coprinellus aureogranulatus]